MATIRQWLILFLLAAIWGSSFILIKRGLFTPEGTPLFSGIQVGSMRVVIAAVFMLPLVLRKFRFLKNGRWKYYLLVGLAGNAIPAFLFAVAQTKISSALAGMLNALVPVFSMLIAYFVFKVNVKRVQVIGLVIGLLSAIGLILSAGGDLSANSNIWYSLLVIGATMCYAISLNTIKQFLQEENPIAITGLALVLVSPIGMGVLLGTDFIQKVQTLSGAWYGISSILILGIIGTALALILFNKLVQDTNTIFASSVTYLIPLVAILWGLADGEKFGVLQGLFAITLLGGIFLINRK